MPHESASGKLDFCVLFSVQFLMANEFLSIGVKTSGDCVTQIWLSKDRKNLDRILTTQFACSASHGAGHVHLRFSFISAGGKFRHRLGATGISSRGNLYQNETRNRFQRKENLRRAINVMKLCCQPNENSCGFECSSTRAGFKQIASAYILTTAFNGRN